MRFPAALLCGVFMIAIFVSLFRLEPELSNTGKQDTETLLRAFQVTEKLHQEANLNYQMYEMFNRLREQLFTQSAGIFSSEVEPDYLQKNLPPHDLAVALSATPGVVNKIAQLQGNFDPELIRIFIKFDHLYTRDDGKDVFFSESYREEIEHGDKLLHKLVGNRGDKLSFMPLRSARIAIYGSLNNRLALYWDHQRLETGEKVYFFIRIDLTKAKKLAPYEMVLRKHSSENFHCAYFDLQKQSFIPGYGLEKFKAVEAFAAVDKFCKTQLLAEDRKKSDAFLATIRSGSDIAIIGKEIAGTALVPVVIVSPEIRQQYSLARVENVAVFSLICLGLLIFVQTIAFERGLRLNVGKALIIASLMAIFMPFMMGRSIFMLILTETSENESMKLERDLHSLVSGVDSGVRLFHANLFQNFLRVLSRDDIVLALKAAEEKQREIEASGTMGLIDTTGASEVILKVSNQSFLPFEAGILLNEDRRARANAVLVLGPGNFMRFYDRFKSAVVGHVRDSRNDSMFLLLNLYRLTLEPFFPVSELVPGLSTSSGKDKSVELENFMYDEVKSQIIGTLGKDKFFEMFSNFEGLNMMRTNVGITHFSVFPLYWRGLIQYFCGIGWDEFTISDIYLKTVFANLKVLKSTATSRKSSSIFTFLDPAFYFAKSPVFLQGFGGLRGDTIFSGSSESPRLGMLIKAVARSKRPIKYRSGGEDQAIYQVLPGRYFSLYTLGARQDKSYLLKIEKWRSLIFTAGLVVFLLFAVFAAVNISRSFTGPLEHLLWGISMVEKSDYSIRLKDSREDEFGSISRAFNLMTRRLREKDTLGKFVSESVRKLAGNADLFKKAQQGSEAEVTILFADLEGFAGLVAVADEAEVQRKLEFSLEHFFKFAAESGGEVDKVIGEKMLIIFPHSQLGRRNAALAATKLIKKIMACFKTEKDLKPVFGLNAGRVISGIIGTSAVRMDNTIIGDPVNVAARLCSLADSQTMPVIVSGEICEALGKNYRTRRIEIDKIRGKKQEVEVFSLEI